MSPVLFPRLRLVGVERGFGLIELMISLAIASVLVLGLVAVAGNTQRTYSTQTDLAANNDKERFAAELLGNAVQSAGYFTTPYPVTTAPSKNATFHQEAGTFNAGQVVSGQSGAGATTPDTLNVRFQANAGDTSAPYNCLGAAAQPVGGAAVVYESQLSIVANNLVCNVGTNGGAPANQVVLIDGVSNMKILYGVDTQGVGSASEYLPASQMTAASWKLVRSVMVTFTFVTTTSSPQTYTQIIQVMYETVATST